MSQLRLKLAFQVKDKVSSPIELLYFLAFPWKGISALVGIFFLIGVVYFSPLISDFQKFNETVKRVKRLESRFLRKKQLIESSLEKLKKAKPLPLYTPATLFKEVYSEAVLSGLEVSTAFLSTSSFAVKTLTYPARAVRLTAKGYSDESLKRFLKKCDEGWKKLEFLKASKGQVEVRISGAVKEENGFGGAFTGR